MSLTVPLAVDFWTAASKRRITRELRSLSFRKIALGGWASASFSLDRPLSVDAPEIAQYGDAIISDARSAKIVWQGRQEDPGRGSGSDGEIWRVNAMGPSAHLHDITRPAMYVDTLWTHWLRFFQSGASREDGIAEIIDGAVAAQDDQNMRLMAQGTAWAQNTIVGMKHSLLSETGQTLSRFSVSYDMGETDTDWNLEVALYPANSIELEVNFTTTAAAAARVVTTDFATGQYIVVLRIRQDNAVAQTPTANTWALVTGVRLRSILKDAAGADITTGASYGLNTILASEVVTDLLGRLLNKFDGPNATVTATTYAIEQLIYPDGVTAGQILDDLIANFEPTFRYGAYEWTDRFAASPLNRFEWVEWPTSVRYEADTSDGFDSPGSGDEIYNAVSVRWRDAAGRVRRTQRTQTVGILDDASLTREAWIDLGDEVNTANNAVQAGDSFLSEHGIAPNAGTLRVARRIKDLTAGGYVDPWEIEPGELIRVRNVLPSVDALNVTDRDAVTIFRVQAMEYDSSDNSARLELDSNPRAISSSLGLPARARRR